MTSIRKLKALKIARALAQVSRFKLTNAGPRGEKGAAENFIRAISTPPTPEQVKVIRRKDSELVGYFSREEAEAVIAKAKAQKKATLVIEAA